MEVGVKSTAILFGSPAYAMEGEKISYLNSAFLIAPDNSGSIGTLGRYDKHHLVPFGEYVPMKRLLFFVNKITEGIGDFSPGEGVKSLDMRVGNTLRELVSFSPLICYEGIFPDQVRRFVKGGGDVLVNVTNDAWYGRSSAPYQHLSAAVFRAAENGVYMLRAANSGISAIIDPVGRIKASTALFDETFLTGHIYLQNEKTIYSRRGDLFAIFMSIVTVTSIAVSLKTVKNVSKGVDS